MSKKIEKVFVGLSGGVDSSVSALLLKKQGYEVIGVFIKGWQPDWIPCTWKDDRISAMRTAAHLDIPFMTLDLEQTYKNKVVKYLLEEYKNGRTPNPDMLCNKEVKFGEFFKWAISMGADKIAMGHYAIVNDNFELLESVDKEKDQTYFLSQLTHKELSKTFFPIGHLQKSDVRKIAESNNLPVASRKDSQGICFVGDLEMKDFLKRELSPEKGNVINENGEIIGEHEGAILYTIGERHGFRILKKEGDENISKYFVIGKNIEKNLLIVSVSAISNEESSKEKFLKIKNLSCTNSFDDLKKINNLSIRIRYRGQKIPVEVKDYDLDKKEISLNFKNAKDSDLHYAFGQFAVFYDDEKCLGGGELC